MGRGGATHPGPAGRHTPASSSYQFLRPRGASGGGAADGPARQAAPARGAATPRQAEAAPAQGGTPAPASARRSEKRWAVSGGSATASVIR